MHFRSASGLGRHHQASGHGPSYEPLPIRHKRRYKYSFRRKRELILQVLQATEALSGDAHQAKVLISNRTGVSSSNLYKWVQNKDFIFRCARTPRLGNKNRFRLVLPKWPEAELQLYFRFIYRRRYQALRVSRKWLRDNLKDIRANRGHDVDGWYPSEGWCSRFCRRWEITSQCRTNKKKFSIEERMPAIQAFHQDWIYGIQRSGVQRCPKYGQYPASTIYSTDQVPMPFSSPAKRSLNEKGSKRGNRFTGASEDDKRFCTLNVTLCAKEDEQDVRIELIFRNETQGAGLTANERAYYDNFPNVQVRWQPSAWADEGICIDFIRDFRRQTLDKGDVVLVMDQHSSQHTPLAQAVMTFRDIRPVFTPANCTDCVSPVDRNVGQWLKQRVYAMQEAEVSKAENRLWAYPATKGGLSVSDKRKLLVRWVSAAWDEMKRERHHCIKSAFVDTGVLIAKDGSENGLIDCGQRLHLGCMGFESVVHVFSFDPLYN